MTGRPSQSFATSNNVKLEATQQGVVVSYEHDPYTTQILTTFNWNQIQRLVDYKAENWP